ncbi:hypothetical protein AB0O95_13020 [Rhodoglobus sp. NPDC076762]
MAMTNEASQSPAKFATVAAVLAWAVVIPLLNVVLPLAFQLWNEYSLIAFFGELPSPEEIRAQHWKLVVARLTSTTGSALIIAAVVVLARMKIVRRNLYFALGLSAALSALWFAVNR